MAEKEKEPKETMDLRFKDSLPLQRFRGLTIGIAGLGAIGHQVATLLAGMGHKQLWGADFDKVELKNLGTQGWSYKDIGIYKCAVMQEDLTSKHSKFVGYNTKFEDAPMLLKRDTQVFFCCVDNMAARHDIWGQITKPYVPIEARENVTFLAPRSLNGLYIDARMTPGVIRILTTDLGNEKARKYYETTLYRDNEAVEGACTDRMTIFGAYVAGGLMVSQLVNWLNGIPLVGDFLFETQRMTSTYLDPQAKKTNKNRATKNGL